MSVVYARKEKTYIWSDNNETHKAGWVPIYEPLDTDGEGPRGWYAIKRPLNISLPVDPAYPFYWVKVGDTVEKYSEPEPVPTPVSHGDVTDWEVAESIVTILKWLRQ